MDKRLTWAVSGITLIASAAPAFAACGAKAGTRRGPTAYRGAGGALAPSFDAAADGEAGSLAVSGTAGAAVYVAGKSVGTTPLEGARLAPGEYKVKVAKYGYRSREATVRVESGKTAKLDAALEKLP